MDEAAAVAAFTFDEQKLELDISFSPREVRGRTTINVQPSSSGLREIHLNCRQLKPTSVTVAGRNAAFNYSDLYDRLSLYPTTGIEQYHFPQNRLRRHESGAEEELVIFIPDKLRIKEIKEPGSDDVSFDPLEVVIGYTLDDFRDGLHFVGVEDGDSRYPHVFTRNSPFAGFASCFFPCLDDGTKRCNFEVSIRYPRTVGEALSKNSGAQDEALANGTHKADSVMSESDDDPNDLSEEEKALEMWCICSGVLTDDVSLSRTFLFSSKLHRLLIPPIRLEKRPASILIPPPESSPSISASPLPRSKKWISLNIVTHLRMIVCRTRLSRSMLSACQGRKTNSGIAP